MGVMTAREFHQNKASVLARVEGGETISLTKHGRAIARIVPENADRPQPGTPEWQAAYDHMMALMKSGFSWGGKISYGDKHD